MGRSVDTIPPKKILCVLGQKSRRPHPRNVSACAWRSQCTKGERLLGIIGDFTCSPLETETPNHFIPSGSVSVNCTPYIDRIGSRGKSRSRIPAIQSPPLNYSSALWDDAAHDDEPPNCRRTMFLSCTQTKAILPKRKRRLLFARSKIRPVYRKELPFARRLALNVQPERELWRHLLRRHLCRLMQEKSLRLTHTSRKTVSMLLQSLLSEKACFHRNYVERNSVERGLLLEVERLKQLLETCKDHTAALRRAIATLQARELQYKADLQSCSTSNQPGNSVKALQSKLEDALDALTQSRKETNALELSRQLDVVKSKTVLAGLQSRLNKAQQDKQQQEAASKLFEKHIAALTGEIASLKESLRQALEQNNDLEKQAAVAFETQKNLDRQRQTAENEALQWKSEVLNMQQSLELSAGTNERAQREIGDMQRQLALASTTIRNLKEENDRILDEVAAARTASQAFAREKDALNSKIQRLDREIQSIREEKQRQYDTLVSEVKALEKRNAEMREMTKKNEDNSLELEKQKRSTELFEHERTVARYESEIISLQQEKNMNANRMRELEVELRGAHAELATQRQIGDSLRRETVSLQREVDKLRVEESSLRRETVSLQREVDKLRVEESSLRHEVDSLKREVTAALGRPAASSPASNGKRVTLRKWHASSSHVFLPPSQKILNVQRQVNVIQIVGPPKDDLSATPPTANRTPVLPTARARLPPVPKKLPSIIPKKAILPMHERLLANAETASQALLKRKPLANELAAVAVSGSEQQKHRNAL